MSIEPRPPPPQFAARLRRALGGRAGWNGFALQIVFVAALVWIGYEIVANARANLEAQRITSGFGFLKNTAGFDVSQNLIPYTGSDSYTRVFLVGLLNTLLVSIIGIFFATVIGFMVALGRLSPNWLLVAYLRRLCRAGPQPAAPVPDPVLVSRRAGGAAEPAAERLAVRQLLSQQSRPGDSEADRQSRLRALRGCRPDRDRGRHRVVALCAPAVVRKRQGDQGLALRARSPDRPAARLRADLRRAGDV